jgi:hypothetical protein
MKTKSRAANLLWSAALGLALIPFTTATSFADHNLKITNDGDHTILEVHISGANLEEWGPDLLGEGVVIGPGESVNFTIRQGCDEDIKLVYHDSEKIFTEKIFMQFDTCQYDLRATY